MANTSAPFGFMPVGTVGGVPNFRLSQRRIISTNSTAIYKGDAVVPDLTTDHGYIEQATAGTTPLAGIFWGCEYLSVSQKRKVWSAYWPGSDASGDVTAYVIDAPDMLFKVQSTGVSTVVTGTTSAWATAPIGKLINIAVGTGSTATGLSGMMVDGATIATTATLPFKIVGMVSDPPGANGADPTTAYNQLLVTFNDSMLARHGLTGVTFS